MDPPGKLGGVGSIEQVFDGHVVKYRICDRGIPIGEGQLRGLDAQMDPTGIRDALRPERGGRRRLETFEHVQELERDDPRAVRRVRRDLNPAICGGDWIRERTEMVGKIAGRDERSRAFQATRELGGELALIEVVEPGIREALERRS